MFALHERGRDRIGTNALAERLGVTAGAVTSTLKRMGAVGLVDHQPYHGASLTTTGRELALGVLRNHRLLETFLNQELGMSWDRVHAEAEILEHHISTEVGERLASALGDPQVDPHGDPIPNRDLALAESSTSIALADLPAGEPATVLRVSDSSPELLRLLEQVGISIGTELEVKSREQFGDLVRLRLGSRDQVLSRDVAAKIRVGAV